MAQWLPVDLQVHAFAEHDAGVPMAKIFDTERRQASPTKRTLKVVEHGAGVDGSSVSLGKDEVVTLIEQTERVSSRRLADAMILGHLDHAGIERDGAS